MLSFQSIPHLSFPHCVQSVMGFHIFMTNSYYAGLGGLILETILCCKYDCIGVQLLHLYAHILSGIYTLLFGCTICKCRLLSELYDDPDILLWPPPIGLLLLRRSRFGYMFSLVILWLLIICTLVLDWYRYDLQFWSNLSIPSILLGAEIALDQSLWTGIDNILSVLVIIIADTLLVSQKITDIVKLAEYCWSPAAMIDIPLLYCLWGEEVDFGRFRLFDPRRRR